MIKRLTDKKEEIREKIDEGWGLVKMSRYFRVDLATIKRFIKNNFSGAHIDRLVTKGEERVKRLLDDEEKLRSVGYDMEQAALLANISVSRFKVLSRGRWTLQKKQYLIDKKKNEKLSEGEEDFLANSCRPQIKGGNPYKGVKGYGTTFFICKGRRFDLTPKIKKKEYIGKDETYNY